jgi:Gas vesicle protein G
MFLLDSFLIFTLDKIRQVAEQELENPEALQQRLLEAQMQLEDGTIDDETFAAIERDVFVRLREMKGQEGASGVADASAFEDVEIEVVEDDRS